MHTGAATNETRHRGYRFGPFCLDIDRAALLNNCETVRLRRQSFDVLRYLVERHGRLVKKEELLQAIWGNTPVTDDSLTHCLIDIRKVLGDSQHELIRTVPRRGYIFDIPVHPLREQSKPSFVLMAFAACLVAAVTFLAVTSTSYSNHEDDFDTQVVVDADATGLYLQARFLFNRRGPRDIENARQFYLQAIDIEPEYADAWAGVAATHYIEYAENEADKSKLAIIKAFAEKSIAIDPDNAEGRLRLARYYHLIGDDEAADRHLLHAFSKHPHDPLLLTVMAGRYERQGNLDLAIEVSFEAVELDPLSMVYRGNLSWYLFAASRYEEAIEQSMRASALSSRPAEFEQLVSGLALIKLRRFQEALDITVGWSHVAEFYQVRAMAYFGLGKDLQARRAVKILRTFPAAGDTLRLAELQAYCDEIELAFRSLSQMRGQLLMESQFLAMNTHIQSIELSPFMENIRADGRWDAWLAETREMMSEDLILSRN